MLDGLEVVAGALRCLRGAGDGDGVSARKEEAGVLGGVRSMLGTGKWDGAPGFSKKPFNGLEGVPDMLANFEGGFPIYYLRLRGRPLDEGDMFSGL